MTDGKTYFDLSDEQWETIFRGKEKIDKVLKSTKKMTEKQFFLLVCDLWWLRYQEKGKTWYELTDYLREKLKQDGASISYIDKEEDIKFWHSKFTNCVELSVVEDLLKVEKRKIKTHKNMEDLETKIGGEETPEGDEGGIKVEEPELVGV